VVEERSDDTAGIAVDATPQIHSRGGMLDDAQREQLKPLARTMQIIVGALAIGVLNFEVIALFIVTSSKDPAVDPPPMTYAAIGAAVIAFFASALVPMFLAGPMKQQIATAQTVTGAKPDFRRYAGLYQTLLIIRCAILEGAAFFCLVSFTIEHHIAGPIVATLLLLAILVQFPTLSRLESWIETELVATAQLQQLGR
jgi:hypothetical protein